jgi:hypothetical protein
MKYRPVQSRVHCEPAIGQGGSWHRLASYAIAFCFIVLYYSHYIENRLLAGGRFANVAQRKGGSVTIQVHCPSCRCSLRASEKTVGRTARCPRCKSTFVVTVAATQVPTDEARVGSATDIPLPRKTTSPHAAHPDHISGETGTTSRGAVVAEAYDGAPHATSGRRVLQLLVGACLVAVVIGLALAWLGDKSVTITFEEFKSKLSEVAKSGGTTTEPCSRCSGSGKVLEKGEEQYPCPECKGVYTEGKTRRVSGFPFAPDTCIKCQGTGKMTAGFEQRTCDRCDGRGKLTNRPYPNKCSVCHGTGKDSRGQPCHLCDGQKERWDRCRTCGGRGSLTKKVEKAQICNYCEGKGKYEKKQPPTVSQFTRSLGEPFKKQEVEPGAQYWYFLCTEGVIQLEVVLFEGGRIRWGYPRLY